MAIPESFLDDLVSRTDITDLVGSYVKLSKRSGTNMFGLCPFHSEKTPSFSVSTDKQIYHCFGCGKGGGAISFIMEIENVSFRDAVEMLAQRAGMTVPEDNTSEEKAGRNRRLLELNRDAARHFHEMLKSPIGRPALEYINGRGISKDVITRFGIGAAPDAWSLLLESMTKKGYTHSELIEAGLARAGRNKGGAYDMFRNRVMFPVIDVRGSVIGFSGRVLGTEEPKYLNSPDTPVFSKRRSLFAINIAKKSKAGMLILVEGNMDVVALHKAGFDSAVASLGTALTDEQARLMARYSDSVVVAYDSDDAGRKAALRAIPLLEKTGMRVKIVDMGESKDPDEYLRRNKPEAFKILIERSENHIEYQLITIKNKHDLTSDMGRISYLAEATDLLGQLNSEPEREVYSARVACEVGISAESVQSEAVKKSKNWKAKKKKEYERKAARPAALAQPKEKSLRYANEGSALAEEGIIRCLICENSLFEVVEELNLKQEEFTSPFLERVYSTLLNRITNGRDTSGALMMTELSPDEASLLTTILHKPETMPNSEKAIREYIGKIRAEKYKAVNPDKSLLLEVKKYKQESEAKC